MKIFSDRLSDEMKDAGLTQTALATRCGVAQSRVSAWLKGESRPQPRTLEAIANSLGVRAEWLLTGQGERLNEESERIGEAVRRTLPILSNDAANEPDAPLSSLEQLATELRHAGEALTRAAFLVEKLQQKLR